MKQCWIAINVDKQHNRKILQNMNIKKRNSIKTLLRWKPLTKHNYQTWKSWGWKKLKSQKGEWTNVSNITKLVANANFSSSALIKTLNFLKKKQKFHKTKTNINLGLQNEHLKWKKIK